MRTLTRRQSIRILSTGVLAFPRLTRCTEHPDALRFGVVGFGASGETLTVQLLGSDKRNVVSAICDISEHQQKRGEALVRSVSGQTPNLYTDCLEMLQREKGRLDAVIVATPDCFHEYHSLSCFEAGLHVYCESPIADSSASARRMVAAAKASNLIFQYASLLGKNPWMCYCKRNFVNGAQLLGPILLVDSELRSFPQRRNVSTRTQGVPDVVLSKYGYQSNDELLNWRFAKKFGVSYELSCFVQQADFFNYMLSAYPRGLVASSCEMSGTPLARAVSVSLDYEIAGQSVLCNSRFFPVSAGENGQEYKITGWYGIVKRTILDQYVQQIDASLGTSQDEALRVRTKWEEAFRKGVLGKEDRQKEEMDGYIPLPFERGHNRKFHFSVDKEYDGMSFGIRSFVKAIRDGSPACGTAQDGLASLILAEGVQESIRTGKRLFF